MLRRGVLFIFRIEYNKYLVEIKLKRYSGFSFPKPEKKDKGFYTSVDLEGTPNPNSYLIFFSFEVHFIAPVEARHALY